MTADRGSVRGWLRRVAHNLVVDGYRAARSRPQETELFGAPEPPVADRTDEVVNQILVRQALRILSPEQREALMEMVMRDQTAAQASQRLGIPVGTMKSRALYGLRRLRDLVDLAALAG